MKLKLALMSLALAMLLAPVSLARDADKPTVALLRFGNVVGGALIEEAIFSQLQLAGWITEEDLGKPGRKR